MRKKKGGHDCSPGRLRRRVTVDLRESTPEASERSRLNQAVGRGQGQVRKRREREQREHPGTRRLRGKEALAKMVDVIKGSEVGGWEVGSLAQGLDWSG